MKNIAKIRLIDKNIRIEKIGLVLNRINGFTTSYSVDESNSEMIINLIPTAKHEKMHEDATSFTPRI